MIIAATTAIPADKIVAKVKAIRGENADASVTISGDTMSEYGRVINLMALLKEAGIDKVGLKTEARPSVKEK